MSEVLIILGVAKLLAELAIKAKEHSEKRVAYAKTYREWEESLAFHNPKLYRKIMQKRNELNSFREKKQWLEQNINQQPIPYYLAKTDTLNKFIDHSQIIANEEGIFLKLGLTPETSSLQQEKHLLSSMSFKIPTYKITLLGPSKSGKTVYMSSMYNRFSHGVNGFNLKTLNHIDTKLQDIFLKIHEDRVWPRGNMGTELENYQFTLSNDGKDLAVIDWVDYRGGALEEPDSEDAEKLINRLKESHAIICFIDLSLLGHQNYKVNSILSRIKTKVGKITSLCKQAIEDSTDAKSWIFVRPKSDLVITNETIDLVKAKNEMREHLDEVLRTITALGKFNTSALVPISSVGMVRTSQDQETGEYSYTLTGEDPINVEWPILLAITAILTIETQIYDREIQYIEKCLNERRNNRNVPLEFINNLQSIEHVSGKIRWNELADHFKLLVQRQKIIEAIIEEILNECPNDTVEIISKQDLVSS